MYLKNLGIKRFRNLVEADLNWNSGFNIVWGNNAQGKTNLLEAIYLLGHLKSFRNARGKDMISHSASSAFIGATVDVGRVSQRIELILEQNGRIPRLNGKTVKKLSEFIGYLRPILFTPEEMGLIKGYPAGRRALLDRAIVQQDPLYLDRVQEFTRILKQRNLLLKKNATTGELEPWTCAFAAAGSRLQRDRLIFLNNFIPLLKKAYCEIAENREQPHILYPVEMADPEQMKESLLDQLARNGDRERLLGQTLAGPHRDDPEFLINGKELRLFGSQGQQRCFLLAFKAAQVVGLEQQLGEPPVLLLDDLTSELDVHRQRGFFDFLQARKGQVFITTTRPQLLGDYGPSEARFFEVNNGTIRIN